MSKLSFLVGYPRSGKSTFSSSWIKTKDPQNFHRIVINQDNIRLALTGERYNSHAEGIVKEATYLMIKTFLHSGYHILYDETNTSLNSVKNIYQIDKNAEPIFIFTQHEICKQRAIDTNQPDLCKAIDRMHKNLRNLWCRYTVFDQHEFSFSEDNADLWKQIFQAINNETEQHAKHIIR